MKPEELKLLVKEKYSIVAERGSDTGCCSTVNCCGTSGFSMTGGSYSDSPGYQPEADYGLGCGLPVGYSAIKTGDHVLDLGCGAGNDCFVARSLTGGSGTVTGLDFTEAMLEKANENLEKTGYANVNFILGDIENMPFEPHSFDVVISNCVLNLVPDKRRAFSEIYRVLKPGGQFCISDVVLSGGLPARLKEVATLYAGCVSGALVKTEYMELISDVGFQGIAILEERVISIPEKVLREYLTDRELTDYTRSAHRIMSITLTGSR
ncbi:MAG: arsenite methyltransferase [Bacteroidota bacterium]